MSGFDALTANDADLAKTRQKVREFLDADRAEHGWRPAVDSWLSGWDEEFSARLAAAGFVGMTIPQQYGGAGLGFLDRYVATEELLAAGAPVAAHWVADRQVAPTVLNYGTDDQKSRILPQIATGELFSAIGMSEPGAGSDLAAASTRATRVDGGWIVNGTKVWTSGAHHAHMIVTLVRTSPLDSDHRHAGFSQLIIPRDAPGVHISPIRLMSGEHHFNEVLFDEVFVEDADVLGEIGNGWHQVTAELSYERSGPERLLTTMPLIDAAVGSVASNEPDATTTAAVGELAAQLISLRQVSVSVARSLAAGESPANQAALVKDMGTRFEQDSIDAVAGLIGAHEPDAATADLLAVARAHQPLFTLRGGTNEVLRGVIARGMGLR